VTDFTNIIKILGEFYSNYRDDDELEDFFEFNDLGAPLAYLTSERLCEISDDGKKYVAETWEVFLVWLGIQDTGFDNLEEILSKRGIQE